MASALATSYRSFDADDFLRTTYYNVDFPDKIQFRLEGYHKAYARLPRGLKVLDYGAGPSIISIISAASRASEITLADIAEGNRGALKKWLEGDPAAFNWSPFFDRVVQGLEGKSTQAAREREERVRQVVKYVVHCDINEDPPVQAGYEGPYDVVMDSWCLPYACPTKEAYERGVAKLIGLLKVGGTLMIFCSQREQAGSYVVGHTTYPSLPLNGEYVARVVQEQGLSEITLETCSRQPSHDPRDNRDLTNTGYLFVTAKKID